MSKYVSIDTMQLKNIQRLRGMTNVVVAEASGISPEHFSRFFRNNTKKVFKRTASSLASVLHVQVEDIAVRNEVE